MLRVRGYANLNFCAVVRGKWKCVRARSVPREGFEAGVAQLVEHLICNQRVGGSNPFASSTQSEAGIRKNETAGDFPAACFSGAGPVLRGESTSSAGSAKSGSIRWLRRARKAGWEGVWWVGDLASHPNRSPRRPVRMGHPRRWGTRRRVELVVWAQVAERLMAADCKSAAPCELRRFESSPVHHTEQGRRERD